MSARSKPPFGSSHPGAHGLTIRDLLYGHTVREIADTGHVVPEWRVSCECGWNGLVGCESAGYARFVWHLSANAYAAISLLDAAPERFQAHDPENGGSFHYRLVTDPHWGRSATTAIATQIMPAGLCPTCKAPNHGGYITPGCDTCDAEAYFGRVSLASRGDA